MSKQHKFGFTLVELSIVLVIIGLLISGVLVAQNIIDNAKLQNEVRRLTQYSIAVVNFNDKFDQEAGDSDLFVPNGNNNGRNDDYTGSCPTHYIESLSAWKHLSDSGMLSEGYALNSPSYECPGGYNDYEGVAPTTKTEANDQVNAIHFLQKEFGTPLYNNFSYFLVFHPIYNRGFLAHYDPEMLWGLENKLDDGVIEISGSGKIYSTETEFGNACTHGAMEDIENFGSPSSKFCIVVLFFNDFM